MAHRVTEPFSNPGIPLLSQEAHAEKETAEQGNSTVGALLGLLMAIIYVNGNMAPGHAEKFCICAKTPFLPSASPYSKVNLELQEGASVSRSELRFQGPKRPMLAPHEDSVAPLLL